MNDKRKLGFRGVFCIACGAMIGPGLFVLPGLAFAQAGKAVVLSYALAAVAVIPAMLSRAELATVTSRGAGGFFVWRGMGPLPGTLAGLAGWFSIALTGAFALVGMAALARLVWPGVGEWSIKGVAIGCCVLLIALNVAGARSPRVVRILPAVAVAGVLAAFVGLGLVKGGIGREHFADFMSADVRSVLGAVALVVISFAGLTRAASAPEDVRRPGHTIPRGMLAALIAVTLLYTAAVFVTVAVVKEDQLANTLAPLALAAGELHGWTGTAVLAGAAALALFATAGTSMLAAFHGTATMSREGLLPAGMGKTSGSRRAGSASRVGIIVTGMLMIAAIAALSIFELVVAAATMLLMFFILVNLGVLMLRSSGAADYGPLYRSPLCPWLQLAGIAVYAFLMTALGRSSLLMAAWFVLLGLFWYAVYVHWRIADEHALVRAVGKAVSGDIRDRQLEGELAELAREHDEVIHEWLDLLVARCEALDVSGFVRADELFSRAAEALAPRVNVEAGKLRELLQQREAQSSTVVQPGVAVVHVTVDGEKVFEVLIVRCRDGATFRQQDEPVRAAFVVVGTADQRSRHLKTLMAIAHVVREHDFVERWLAGPETPSSDNATPEADAG